MRGGDIIVSISGREEKLRVLSSKPDRYVFDNNLNKRIHDAQRRPWGAHRTETRVAVAATDRVPGAFLAASDTDAARGSRMQSRQAVAAPDWRRHDPHISIKHDIEHVVSVPLKSKAVPWPGTWT